jgi:Tfp pilus assembly protein PilV
MTAPRRRRQGGFSMVEFLVAAFILAIGLLGLIALQVGAVVQAANGRGRITATYVANQVLQQAQMEGQYTYFAKATGATLPAGFTPVFTASPGAAIASTAIGGFNVDGVQVTDATGAAMPSAYLDAQVPDINKRSPVFTANWVRRAYQGKSPASTIQTQEFVVNVAWQEKNLPKSLSMSRDIRY